MTTNKNFISPEQADKFFENLGLEQEDGRLLGGLLSNLKKDVKEQGEMDLIEVDTFLTNYLLRIYREDIDAGEVAVKELSLENPEAANKFNSLLLHGGLDSVTSDLQLILEVYNGLISKYPNEPSFYNNRAHIRAELFDPAFMDDYEKAGKL